MGGRRGYERLVTRLLSIIRPGAGVVMSRRAIATLTLAMKWRR